MSKLVWDNTGNKFFETGVSQGVLYVQTNGTYGNGVAWNGLTAVTESPAGAELTDLYADDIKYASLRSAETFGATIEAYTYPDEFAVCDGSVEATDGVYLGQQGRSPFGFVYKTKVASDADPDGTNYKLHIVYGATASPSEKAYNSVNDSPEAITFSWEIATVPVPVTGRKPTSLIIIDSRTADATKLAALELTLFGDTSTQPTLPLPDAIITAMTPSGG